MVEPVVEIVGASLDPVRFARKVDTQDAGAVVTFTGLCRSEDGRLSALELEHYPGMAERQLTKIARETAAGFDLVGLGVAHRHGVVPIGETIVCVVAAARHRSEAFDAASRLMDYLKTDAPFWKKEHPRDGAEGEWIAAREADNRAKERWNA